jgi:hypothetical protein
VTEEEGSRTDASLRPGYLSLERWTAVPSFVLSPWFIQALISCTPKAEAGIIHSRIGVAVFVQPHIML